MVNVKLLKHLLFSAEYCTNGNKGSVCVRERANVQVLSLTWFVTRC